MRRLTFFGGNSGYVGYSKSVRAVEAEKEGKFPKTRFKKNYHISEKIFQDFLNRGLIEITEWHHTSKYGNMTDYYGIVNKPLFFLLIGNKQMAYEFYIQEKQEELKIQDEINENILHKRCNRKSCWERRTELRKKEISEFILNFKPFKLNGWKYSINPIFRFDEYKFIKTRGDEWHLVCYDEIIKKYPKQ